MSEFAEGLKKVVGRVDKLVDTFKQGAKEALELVEELERMKALGKGKDDDPGEKEKVE